ncbi:replication initiation factor domain-containing protein [Oscillatoria amoena NRMC-F 0135]|nr:replication initiation factor domain-containing protein [Oscillatoria amoena NRMC-F 0135]
MTKGKKGQTGKADPRELYGGQNYITELQKLAKTRYSISLDWLKLYCTGETYTEKEVIVGDFVLSHKGYGMGIYSDSYEVYDGGVKIGMFHCNPKSDKIMKPDASHIEIENSLLYTDFWLPVVEDLTASLGVEIKNYTRVDIALDGLNHIPDFLNVYAKQQAGRKGFHCLGKAKWNSLVLDHSNLKYRAFKIGSNTSDKQVTIYNKTKELENSNKTYIKKFWEKNGVDTSGDVWRVEMRLKGDELKLIKELSIQQLNDSRKLEQVFCHKSKKFFEFTIHDSDTNITRQERLKLIHFHRDAMEPLDKNEKPLTDGRYKMKMSLHQSVKNLCTNVAATTSERTTMIDNIDFGVYKYNLNEWLHKRLPDWVRLYAGENTPEELEPYLN